jgi:CheY-like chemotaxis protein/HPt (histidine-containing phosphotransfer) domain-containing protein
MDARPLSVLVVDDNPGDAKLVELALARGGEFRCERAGRIQLALERLAAAPVDAVLLDLGLPDSRGTQGLRRLRAAAPGVAVVVLTGSEDPELLRRAIAEGAQEYQVKGIFPPDYLGRVVRAAVRRQRLEAALARGEEPGIEGEGADDDDALAIVAARGPLRANARFRAAVRATGSALAPTPEWLRALLESAHRPSGPGTPGGPSPAGAMGVTRVPGPDGEPVEVTYVVRWFGAGPDERALLRLHRSGGAVPTIDVGSPPARSAPDPIDPAAWEQLTELAAGDAHFLPVLRDAFLEESEASVARLDAAVAAGDRVAVADAVHRLKSSCAQVGAIALSRRCAALERDAGGLPAPEVADAVRSIATEVRGVTAALRRRISGS